MIDSGIWWRRTRGLTAALSLTPLLTACAGLNLFTGQAPSPLPEPLPPPRAETAAQTDLASGLDPLPSEQQLLSSVPFGRIDPFGPLPVVVGPSGEAAGASASGAASAAAQAAAARQDLSGLQLTGVIQGGSTPEALVTYGSLSGSLKLGDRGGRTPLLPPGWRVTQIGLGGRSLQDPPSITLVNAGQRLTLKL